MGREIFQSQCYCPQSFHRILTSLKKSWGDFLWPRHRDLLLKVRSKNQQHEKHGSTRSISWSMGVKNATSQDLPGGPVVRTVLPVQGTRVQSLAGEVEPTCYKSAKDSACHSGILCAATKTQQNQILKNSPSQALAQAYWVRVYSLTRSPGSCMHIKGWGALDQNSLKSLLTCFLVRKRPS